MQKLKSLKSGVLDLPHRSAAGLDISALLNLVADEVYWKFVGPTQINHMIQMIERAMDHNGFSVIECFSECVEFYPGAFDPANPRKGGTFGLIDEKKWDGTPEDELRHDVTDEIAAYRLANVPFPGLFGVFFENDRPTKNALASLPHCSLRRASPIDCFSEGGII